MEIAEEKKKRIYLFHPLPRVSDSGYSSTEPRTGCGRMEKGWCKLIRMQKEMPRDRSAGDARTARKKGRKDNEYDVNFKADWGRSNHRRRGSATPSPTPHPPLPPRPCPRDSRATHTDFELWLCRNKGKQRKPGRQAGGHVSYMFYAVLTGVLWQGASCVRQF